MYQFILNQWIMGKYTKAQVEACVGKGYITEDQAATIEATPQATGGSN